MVSMAPDDMKPFFVQATNTCIPMICMYNLITIMRVLKNLFY